MPRVVGLTRAELLAREQVFEGLTAKAVKMSVRALTANLSSIVTAAPTLSATDQNIVTSTWNSYVAAELYPYLIQTFVDSAGDVRSKIDGLTNDAIPKVDTDFAIQYLRQANNRLKGIADVIWLNMREQLAEGYEAGESTQQLAARLRAVASISEPRALMIARTEIVPAANFASLYQVQLAGFTDDECQKGWMSTEDPRTRPAHLAADGQRVPLSKPFTVDGEKLNFPGDWSLGATADNVINCRCSVDYHFDDDDDDTLTADANFERLHPRAPDGKFGTKSPFIILPKSERGRSGDKRYAPGVFGRYGGAGVMMRHVDSAGVARYMVVQRAGFGSGRWRWQLPGGARDEHETAAQAAARESAEEIGATPEILASLTPRGEHRVEVPVEGRDPWSYTTLTADIPAQFKPDIDYNELGAARWLTYDQLDEMRGRGRLITPFAAQLDDIIAKFDEPEVAGVLGFQVTNVTKESSRPRYNVHMTAAAKRHLPDSNWDESQVKRDTEGKFAKKAGLSKLSSTMKQSPMKKAAAAKKAAAKKIGSKPVATGQVAVTAKPLHINTNVIYKQKYDDGVVVAEKTMPSGVKFRLIWDAGSKKFVQQGYNSVVGDWVHTESFNKGEAYKKFSKETGWTEPAPDFTAPIVIKEMKEVTAPTVTPKTIPDFYADSMADVNAWYKNLTQDQYDALSTSDQIDAKNNAKFYSLKYEQKIDQFDAAADEEFDSVSTPSLTDPDYMGDDDEEFDSSFDANAAHAKAMGVSPDDGDDDAVTPADIAGMHAIELGEKLDKMDPGQFVTWFDENLPTKEKWDALDPSLKAHIKSLATVMDGFFGLKGPKDAVEKWENAPATPAAIHKGGVAGIANIDAMDPPEFEAWFYTTFSFNKSNWDGLTQEQRNSITKKAHDNGDQNTLDSIKSWLILDLTSEQWSKYSPAEKKQIEQDAMNLESKGLLTNLEAMNFVKMKGVGDALSPKSPGIDIKAVKSMTPLTFTGWFINNFKNNKDKWDNLTQSEKSQLTSKAGSVSGSGFVLPLETIYDWNSQTNPNVGVVNTPPKPTPGPGVHPYHTQVHAAVTPISAIGQPHSTSFGTTFNNLTPADAVAMQNYMLNSSGKNLTPDQIAAVQRYTTSVGYRSTNAVLRNDLTQINSLGDYDLKAGIKNAVDLQDVMTPITQNVQVFRGTGAHAFGQKSVNANFAQLKALEGKTLTDQGFISTTVLDKPPVSYDYAKKPIQMIVDVPAGSPAAYVSAITPGWSQENELILGAGSSYRINEVREATAADKAHFGNHVEHIVHVRIVPTTSSGSHPISSPSDAGKTPKPTTTISAPAAPTPPTAPASVTVKPTPIKLNTNIIHKQKYVHGAVVGVRPIGPGGGMITTRLVWNENAKKFVVQVDPTDTGNWVVSNTLSKKDAYQKFSPQTGWVTPQPGESALGSDGFSGYTPKISNPVSVPSAVTPPLATTTATTTATSKTPPLDADTVKNMFGGVPASLTDVQQRQLFDFFKKSTPHGFITLSSSESATFNALKTTLDLHNNAFTTQGDQKLNLLQLLRIIDGESTNKANAIAVSKGQPSVANGGLYEKKIVDWLQTPNGKNEAHTIWSGGDVDETVADLFSSIPEPSAIGTPNATVTKFDVITSQSAIIMQKNMSSTYGAWSPKQVTSIANYTASGYNSINGILRKDPSYTKSKNNVETKNILLRAKNIQSAMYPIPRSIQVYRGTGANQFPGVTAHASFDDIKKLEGKKFIDSGFVSTSVDPDKTFSGVKLTIDVPEGTPAAYVDQVSSASGERELLLAAGTKFRVKSVIQEYGITKVHLVVEA